MTTHIATNPLQQTYSCTIRTLSPVHIGSGIQYKQDLDFVFDHNQIKLLNTNTLFKDLESSGKDQIEGYAQAVETCTSSEWLQKTGLLKKHTRLNGRWEGNKAPQDIHGQMQDAQNDAYIPGSSLKGALRTAIIVSLLNLKKSEILDKDLPNAIPGKFADQKALKKLLGEDPKYNLMRCLSVGDFYSENNNIGLYRVNVFRQTNENKKKIELKFPVCIEGFYPQTDFFGQISLDSFLQNQDKKYKCFNFNHNFDELATNIIMPLRMNANKIIEDELAYLNDNEALKTSEIKSLVAFYKKLQDHIAALNDNEAILPMGWGIGWRGMTGALWEPDSYKNIRAKLKLAGKDNKYINFPFPKSRKIAQMPDGCYPMGWVQLSFHSKADIKEQARQERLKAAEEQKHPWRQPLQQAEIKTEHWGAFQDNVLNNEQLSQYQSQPEVGQRVYALALRLRDQTKKWTPERDQAIAHWLKPSGIHWQPLADKADSNSQEAADPLTQQQTEQIKALHHFGAYQNSDLDLKALTLPALNALEKRMKNDWGCAEKRARRNKKQAHNQVKNLIKQQKSKG